MGQGRWRTGMMAVWVGLVAGTAALVTGGAMLGADAPAPVADNAVQVQPFGAYTPIEPVSRATADMASPVLRPGGDPQQAWLRPAAGAQRMAAPTLLYDNGLPLEDFGQPATQLSLCADECAVSRPGDSIPCNAIPGNFLCLSSGMIRPGFFPLSAASADDFVLEDFVSPDTNFQVSMIRAAFVFFPDTGTPTPDPIATWTGIHVTVYGNSVLNAPGGVPNGDGTFAGDVIFTTLVPAASLTQTQAGSCVPCWVVDIPLSPVNPIDFVLAKGTRYWLSLVPQHPGPPQSFWCLSQVNTGFIAHQGADTGPAFWTEILGNDGTSDCTPPAAFTMTDLSFQIFGEELAPSFIACCDSITSVCRDVVAPMGCTPSEISQSGEICQFFSCKIIGACCDDLTGICIDDVTVAQCPLPASRFTPRVFCADVVPPCGTTEIGACCFVDQPCADLNPTDCSNLGGTWNAGACLAFCCPPSNDDCDNAILLTTDTTTQFSTCGATTDGPSDSPGAPCTDVNQDIWYRYVATCDGQMIVSLCLGTDYDAALAVYDGCVCGASLGPRLACDNDFCGSGGAAALTTTVRKGNCYLIRVGGAGTAIGTGTLTIDCVSPVACCHGDVNGDGLIDLADVPALAAALSSKLATGTLEFCRADVNADGAVNGLDIQAFVDLLLSGAVCPSSAGACCLPNQTCATNTVDGCFAAGGIYLGDGIACMANSCPPPVVGTGCAASCLPPFVECCPGNFNSDGIVNELDLPGFVMALLNKVPPDTPDACLADINLDRLVDGRDISGFITLVLNMTVCLPPANDDCANARLLLCNSRLAMDNSLATTAVGDPNYSCRFGGPAQGVGTLWFSFVATHTTALISTCDSFPPASDTILAVYDGSCPTLANEIACNEDAGGACGRKSQVNLTGLMIGQTYFVQVSSFDAANQGFVALEITCP